MDKYNIFDDLPINPTNSKSNNNNIPLPTDNFDQFFQDQNEIDFLFNETLNNLQDLDVPSGFAQLNQPQQQPAAPNSHNYSRSRSGNAHGHSRQLSGTAIFGYTQHNRDLSIGEFYKNQTSQTPKNYKQPTDLKSISPGDLLKQTNNNNNLNDFVDNEILNFNFEEKPVLLLLEEDEEEENNDNVKYQSSPIKRITTPKTQIKNTTSITQPRTQKQNEYIVTNDNPRSYKFPPSPTPTRIQPIQQQIQPPNVYSAKYLQSLNNKQPHEYVDDIEPLLQDQNQLKYIPIPIQEPKPTNKVQQLPQEQPKNINQGLNFNTFLPPPTPPTLSNGSPEWQSSPEPRSPSPGRAPLQNNQDISPTRNVQQQQNQSFYTPLFNTNTLEQIKQIQDQQQYLQLQYQQNQQQNLSSPYSTINSSPVRYNEVTPVKQNPNLNYTPTKQILEWSPVISPNSKQSLSKQIKNTSSRIRIKKTSLLPPGELDNYWIGPDENKIYTCTYKNCGKNFTRRYNVRSHIQTHLSDRPFGCVYCPKRFVRQHDLNRHVKGHMEARQSKCPCGKEFARIDALRKHQERNICIGGKQGIISKPKKKEMMKLNEGSTNKILDSLKMVVQEENENNNVFN
ncbi:unnamed protein product [Candida verbasci]|uniref:C2H2-type domain-containing protein n=1 Tax=Candida verbasci TaxID=1227364 RepID=A0A9W4TT50_9ASCO|nr:unnamed protein product [Candida verbasci]